LAARHREQLMLLRQARRELRCELNVGEGAARGSGARAPGTYAPLIARIASVRFDSPAGASRR
jgi:hypothetical protein